MADEARDRADRERAARSFWEKVEDATRGNDDLREILHTIAEKMGLET